MRISVLSEQADLPVGTIKFYLREGVLAPGRRTSRTSAEYDETHLQRLRLIRALTEVGGLEIAQVRRVVEVIDSPAPPPIRLMATAQRALTGAPPAPLLTETDEQADAADAPAEGGSGSGYTADDDAGVGDPATAPEAPDATRARQWAEDRGWRIPSGDQLITRLESAWEACDDAGLAISADQLHEYAAAVEEIARIDVANVPREPEQAVRSVILGTVLGDALLASLRLLAQREASYVAARADQEDAKQGGPAVGES